jgi:hypothetical protein
MPGQASRKFVSRDGFVARAFGTRGDSGNIPRIDLMAMASSYLQELCISRLDPPFLVPFGLVSSPRLALLD